MISSCVNSSPARCLFLCDPPAHCLELVTSYTIPFTATNAGLSLPVNVPSSSIPMASRPTKFASFSNCEGTSSFVKNFLDASILYTTPSTLTNSSVCNSLSRLINVYWPLNVFTSNSVRLRAKVIRANTDNTSIENFLIDTTSFRFCSPHT